MGLIIGLDLCDAYTQLSCYEKEKNWTLPTIICKCKNKDEWYVPRLLPSADERLRVSARLKSRVFLPPPGCYPMRRVAFLRRLEDNQNIYPEQLPELP